MKKPGSIVEFSTQRDKELLEAFRKQLHFLGTLSMDEIFLRTSMMPSSRFWVSEHRAATVVSKMLKGDLISSMNPKKREMFFEIFRRVKKELEKKPKMTLTEAVFRVVNSPAPQFYLTQKSTRAMIYRIRA